ncbi:MAG: hypothetical protein ACYC8T_08850, partial [Myxococcaceae bacterium]
SSLRAALLVVGVAMPLAGCALGPQTLTSPCVGQPNDGGTCPPCATTPDCAIVGNRCHATAACVPRAGNWATTMEGCSFEHEPPGEACVCLASVCQRQPTR